MKRLLPLLLLLGLLCGCQSEPAAPSVTTLPTELTSVPTTEATVPTTQPTVPSTTEPSTAPATQPTEPEVVLYRNPLNGQAMDEPYTGRPFAVTISNQKDALPHRSVNQADLYFELLVNGGLTRGLAIFSDITKVESVGPIRSCRYHFVDMAKSYNAVLTYGGGSDQVLEYLNSSGISHLSALQDEIAYRDYDRFNSGYAWEHCLYANGQNLWNMAQKRGIKVVQPEGKNYGLTFTPDATPTDGETANTITIDFWNMFTVLEYSTETGTYLHTAYDIPLVDESTGEREGFKNVLIIHAGVYNEGEYHLYDIEGTGKGYYACNGKIIPITWKRASNSVPFTFFRTDGTALEINVGNSYIGFAPSGRPIVWE